ncbi:hypothetical protein D1614_17415 [Maribellus luteus]|uniref:Uncharacterized protein n=1 Tax=Maribellus luteus TaxID=2305463 RepID=A0A399SV85_9BACT|nr:hypothetical protein D1614_17415 [Maribellus luteus]
MIPIFISFPASDSPLYTSFPFWNLKKIGTIFNKKHEIRNKKILVQIISFSIFFIHYSLFAVSYFPAFFNLGIKATRHRKIRPDDLVGRGQEKG